MFLVPGGFRRTRILANILRSAYHTTRSVEPLALRVSPSYTLLRALGADAVAVAVFNTHSFVKRLTAAGMPEALADELTPLIEDRLATKDDLANLATKADVKAEIADAEAEITR